jgi:hypothetical protein
MAEPNPEDRTRRRAPVDHPEAGAGRGGPAFVFDLDGTLVDSVYQHVLAWREALEAAGIELAVWRIHRRIGMSGGLLVNALLRETGEEYGIGSSLDSARSAGQLSLFDRGLTAFSRGACEKGALTYTSCIGIARTKRGRPCLTTTWQCSRG